MQRYPVFLGIAALAMAGTTSTLMANTRLRLEPGTKLPVRLERGVGTKDFHHWHSFSEVRTVPGTLMQDVATSDGRIAIPSGTSVNVAVLESKRAGHVTGRSRLRLGLYSLSTANGEIIPLDGYPAALEHHKTDREGTAHGNRGLGKDTAVDVTSAATGAGVGFAVAGPVGAAVGAGGGLLVAAVWTVARRGPDLAVPAGTLVEFVLGRPVSVVGTTDQVSDGASLLASAWGRGQAIPPSTDLLDLSDRLNADPGGVLATLKSVKFKDRPAVDRTFACYLEALARFQKGEHDKDTLNLMREAYRDAQATALSTPAREEMARNLVVVMRSTERDWERDPLLNDPQVQAALVEELR